MKINTGCAHAAAFVLAVSTVAGTAAAEPAGEALEFTTLGQSASTPAGWTPSEFSVECWVRVDAFTVSSLTTAAGLVTLGSGGTQNFSLWAFSSFSDPTFWRPGLQINFGNNQAVRSIVDPELRITPDDQVWRHVAATYDGSVARVYLNGQMIAEETWNVPVGTAGGTSLVLGREFPGASEFLDGSMDEVRIWEVARTQQEIEDNWDRVLCGDEPGLWAYYKFNTGATLTDSSGNGRTLTTSGTSAPSGAGELGACGSCASDVTTTNTNPGDAGYGSPDGVSDGADLSYFVERWLAADAAVADVTTTNTNPGDAGYGTPDGGVDGADLSYYVEIWLAGCL